MTLVGVASQASRPHPVSLVSYQAPDFIWHRHLGIGLPRRHHQLGFLLCREGSVGTMSSLSHSVLLGSCSGPGPLSAGLSVGDEQCETSQLEFSSTDAASGSETWMEPVPSPGAQDGWGSREGLHMGPRCESSTRPQVFQPHGCPSVSYLYPPGAWERPTPGRSSPSHQAAYGLPVTAPTAALCPRLTHIPAATSLLEPFPPPTPSLSASPA